MSDSTTTTTFTFPSGDTVDLPTGMVHCTTPDAVTMDINRYVTVGTTPAGRQVRSHFSCAAYARAGHVLDMRASMARMRARADDLEKRGFTAKASNLRRLADDHQADHDTAVAEWAADPAPCTCPQQ